MDSTHQDADLRIKHTVIFSLMSITMFAKLQSSSVLIHILTKECIISLVG